MSKRQKKEVGKSGKKSARNKNLKDLPPTAKQATKVKAGGSGDPLKGLNVTKAGSKSENTLGWTWGKGG